MRAPSRTLSLPRYVSAAAALATLSVSACGTMDEWPDEAFVEAPIVDGVRETGEPAVVSLLGVTGTCSGTLISPQVVLTAKHCVVPERAPGPVAPGFATVGIGDRVIGATRSLRIREIITTPGPLRISGTFDPVNSATGTDIALLVLREPVDDVTPIPVRRSSAEPLTDAAAVAIGFGITRSSGSGVKNRQDTTITRVTPFLLEAIETICQGDSGGPLLVEEAGVREVAGVASFGVYSAAGMVAPCPFDADYWNRVDVQMELIDLALLRAGDCPPSAMPREELCNSLDDDCDGETDEGCLALGETCESDDECAYGPMPEGAAASTDPEPVRCLDFGGGERRCSVSCDATEATGCASITRPLGVGIEPLEGFYCRSTAGCDGACMPGVPGAGANLATCTADTDCGSLRCVDVGGSRICVTPCLADAGSCPLGEICSALTGATGAGACGFCAGAESLPTNRALGEVCASATECASGLCQVVDGTAASSVCTQPCENDGGCPLLGFRCEGGVCAPGARGQLLDPCRDEDDCIRAASCVGDPGAMYCTVNCDEDVDCDASSACDTTATPTRCVARLGPTGAVCMTGTECISGVCLDGACALPCNPRTACAPGLLCTRRSEGAFCQPAAAPIAPPMEMGGCTCRATGSRDWHAALWALGAVVLLTRTRRRR